MKISIENLSKHPQLYTVCAAWAYEQWHKRNNTDFKLVSADYKIRGGKAFLPSTYIAFAGKEAVGMVSIKQNDLITRKDLCPWMSALYVHEKYRGLGLGTLLQKAAIRYVSKRNYSSIYLFVDRNNSDQLFKYYSRRGWEYYDTSEDIMSCKVIIMRYSIR